MIAALLLAGGLMLPADTTPTPVFDQVTLEDSTVMQGAVKCPDGSWIISQLTESGRDGLTGAQHAVNGDLTLTRLWPDGTIRSWMFLKGFDHGISLALSRSDSKLWVWTGAAAVSPDGVADGYATRIAKFAWTAGATLTSGGPGVEMFAPNPAGTHATPNRNGPIMAERYVSGTDGVTRIGIYNYADFSTHVYPAIARIPIDIPPGPGAQGWAVLPGGTEVAYLTGTYYGDDNLPPGNSTLWIIDSQGVVSSTPITVAPDLSYREPETVVPLPNGEICTGFASGVVGARKASIYCGTYPETR